MVVRISRDEAPGWVTGRLAEGRGTRWVGIDGLGAAGKTTLALEIAAALPGAVVVSVDDFARPGVATWDHGLLVRSLVTPLRAGRAGGYRRWDLVAESPLDWVEVPAGRIVLVEGVSATDVRAAVPWDLTLWLDAPEPLRRSRIAARDSHALLDRWTHDWWPEEQAYVAAQHPRSRVDAIITAGP